MAVIQKFSNSELQQEKEKERAMREKKKELRKNLLFSGIHFFISNRIKSKIYKTSSCFKAGVCWRSL